MNAHNSSTVDQGFMFNMLRRKRAALNLKPSSKMWKTDYPSIFITSMKILALNRIFPAPKQTRNLVRVIWE